MDTEVFTEGCRCFVLGDFALQTGDFSPEYLRFFGGSFGSCIYFVGHSGAAVQDCQN
jgi:hypothetical protein